MIFHLFSLSPYIDCLRDIAAAFRCHTLLLRFSDFFFVISLLDYAFRRLFSAIFFFDCCYAMLQRHIDVFRFSLPLLFTLIFMLIFRCCHFRRRHALPLPLEIFLLLRLSDILL